jgi:hypothetical protein
MGDQSRHKEAVMTQQSDRQAGAAADPGAEASPEAIEDLEVKGDDDIAGGKAPYLSYTMNNAMISGS